MNKKISFMLLIFLVISMFSLTSCQTAENQVPKNITLTQDNALHYFDVEIYKDEYSAPYQYVVFELNGLEGYTYNDVTLTIKLSHPGNKYQEFSVDCNAAGNGKKYLEYFIFEGSGEPIKIRLFEYEIISVNGTISLK